MTSERKIAANRRNAESLLVAARLTGDQSLLHEAMEKFPNDPRVDFDAWLGSASPEEKRKWLDIFKQSAPDNAKTLIDALKNLSIVGALFMIAGYGRGTRSNEPAYDV